MSDPIPHIVTPMELYAALLEGKYGSNFGAFFEQHKDLFGGINNYEKNQLLRHCVMRNNPEDLLILLQVCDPKDRNSSVLRLAVVHGKHDCIEVLWKHCDTDQVLYDMRRSYPRMTKLLKSADEFERFVAEQRRKVIVDNIQSLHDTKIRKM